MMRPLTCPKCYEYAVQEQEVRVDLSAVVELDEVVALQARRVARVGGVVRSDVVDAAAGGKGYAAVEGGGVRPEQARVLFSILSQMSVMRSPSFSVVFTHCRVTRWLSAAHLASFTKSSKPMARSSCFFSTSLPL